MSIFREIEDFPLTVIILGVFADQFWGKNLSDPKIQLAFSLDCFLRKSKLIKCGLD
jgi:hypothetical protein